MRNDGGVARAKLILRDSQPSLYDASSHFIIFDLRAGSRRSYVFGVYFVSPRPECIATVLSLAKARADDDATATLFTATLYM